MDTLPGESRVSAQVRHSQKQVGTVLLWSLDRLIPPARTALEFASLLQPDQMPLAWLETLTRGRHAETLADQPRHPATWPAVWRELHGLRLLHPAEHVEVDDQHRLRLPRLVRIHRLVAEHVARNNPEAPRALADVDQFFYELATQFDQKVGQGEDAALRAQPRGSRPGANSARKALKFQSRALGIALKLREGNPQSVFYGRTAARAHIFTFQRAQAAGQQELAAKCLGGFHSVLHELITAGCQFDPPVMQLYQQLHAAAGDPPLNP